MTVEMCHPLPQRIPLQYRSGRREEKRKTKKKKNQLFNYLKDNSYNGGSSLEGGRHRDREFDVK